MTTFLTIMVFCICSEIIGSITMFALNKDWTQEMETRERLLESLHKYSGSDQLEMEVWDLLQSDLQCCGVKSYQDYQSSALYLEKEQLPRSCCGPLQIDRLGNIAKCRSDHQRIKPSLPSTEVFPFSKDTNSLHQLGCQEAITDYLSSKTGLMGAVAASIGVLQISLVTVSAYLVRKWEGPRHCYPCY